MEIARRRQHLDDALFGCYFWLPAGGSGNPCAADDVAIDPSNSNIVFAAIHSDNVFRSTDGGNTWQGMTFPGVDFAKNPMGRASLAISPSSPGTVYAMLGAPAPTYNYIGFFQSSDYGDHWTAGTVPTESWGSISIDGTSGTFSQAYYDQALAVMPDNAAAVYFGGVGPYLRRPPERPGTSSRTQESWAPRQAHTRTSMRWRLTLLIATFSISAMMAGFSVTTSAQAPGSR